MINSSCQSYNVISNNPACVRAPRQSYRKYRYPFRDFYLIMEKPLRFCARKTVKAESRVKHV